MTRSILLIATSLLLLAGPASSQEKIPVLIIDGQNNHDWKATTAALKGTLEATGLFEVHVSTSPGPKAPQQEWAAWRPQFSKYRAVINDYNGRRWPEPVCRAFMDYIHGGGGVLQVHAANNAFSGWYEFETVTGLMWRNAAYGARVTFDPETRRYVRVAKGTGPGAGHGRQHPFAVTVRAPEHPIMAGLAPVWLHAKDELYHGQRGPAANMTVLSTAFSHPGTGGTAAHEPITWVIPHGQGHVVTTVMGHHWRGQKDQDALHCVGFQTIVARTTEWLATGKVTQPVPEAFPGPEKTSIIDPAKGPFKAARTGAGDSESKKNEAP